MVEKTHGSVASHSVMLEKYDQRNMQNYCVLTFYAFFPIPTHVSLLTLSLCINISTSMSRHMSFIYWIFAFLFIRLLKCSVDIYISKCVLAR